MTNEIWGATLFSKDKTLFGSLKNITFLKEPVKFWLKLNVLIFWKFLTLQRSHFIIFYEKFLALDARMF